jgi:hypothetical protein
LVSGTDGTGAYDITTAGNVNAKHRTADGTAAVANGTYTTGLKLTAGGNDGTGAHSNGAGSR